MSTQNLTVIVNPYPGRATLPQFVEAPPAAPPPAPPNKKFSLTQALMDDAPLGPVTLTTDDLFSIRMAVLDRIRTLVYHRWDVGDELTEEVVNLVKQPSRIGTARRHWELAAKLTGLIHQTLLQELDQLPGNKTPKFRAAVRLVTDKRIIARGADSHKNLYLLLGDFGYEWDKKAKAWKGGRVQ